MCTVNNPTEADDPLKWDVAYLTGQKERGDNGTPHYQLYVELAKAQRLSYVKKINGRAHWEPSKGNQQQAIDYCTKDDTRIEEPFEKGTKMATNRTGGTKCGRNDLAAACEVVKSGNLKRLRNEAPEEYVKYSRGLTDLCLHHRDERIEKEIKAQYDEVELRPWQAKLAKELQEKPHPRKIIWIHEAEGNVGKTWLANYLEATQDAVQLDCGKKADLTYMLRTHTGKTTIFSITRTIGEDFMNHVYDLAERIKDNTVISTKYETCRVRLIPQHVVVFANREPDYEKWSSDRYDVRCLGKASPSGAVGLFDKPLTEYQFQIS